MRLCILTEDFHASTVALANSLAIDNNKVDLVFVPGVRGNIHSMEAFEIAKDIKFSIFHLISHNDIRGMEVLENKCNINVVVSKYPIIYQNGIKSVINPLINLCLRSLYNKIKSRKYQFVIVIGQGYFFAKLSNLLQSNGIPNVHTFHEITNRFTDGKLCDSIIYLAKNNVHIVVHSDFCKKQLYEKLDGYNNYIHYIPFGLFKSYLDFNTNDKIIKKVHFKKYVLCYGFIQEYKGFDLLYQAYKEIKSKHDIDFGFVIAGKGYNSYVEKMKQLDDFFIYNNWISNDELVTLIKHSTVVLCPYKSASQSGIPQTAFCFNKPVIATNVGAFSEFIDEKNGLLIDYDKTQLSNAITTFMKNNRCNNVQIDSNYNWDVIRNSYLDLIDRICNS